MRANKVEVHPALMWICDECGRDNFERTIMPEDMNGKSAEELASMFGISVGELLNNLECDEETLDEAAFILGPDEVVCTHCQACFETE